MRHFILQPNELENKKTKQDRAPLSSSQQQIPEGAHQNGIFLSLFLLLFFVSSILFLGIADITGYPDALICLYRANIVECHIKINHVLSRLKSSAPL